VKGGSVSELLSGEVSQRLGVHPDTVNRWAKIGKLKCRLNNHGWRVFNAKAVAEFEKARIRQKARQKKA